jgi:Kelch motif.
MGWGEPAAFNHVVSLVYAQKDGSDPGNVYYIRSTDSGVTFSAPFQLNSNTDATKAQWQPNLSVSEAGTLFATWYDETPRTDPSCQPSSPTRACYQMHSRKSNDNGLTWLPDDTLSDVASPLPLQGDPGIQPTYAGDYDYGSTILTKHVTSWVDGRVPILGASQQDAFTDRELVGFAVTTSSPACNSIINTQPTNFVINLSDAVNTGTVQATDFTVNGTPSNLPPTFANGNTQITFHFSSSPVTTQGPQTMHIPANAFTRVSDNQGNFEFQCSFCFALTPLQVTTTVPPVGGTFSPPAPGDYQYDVNFNQAVDAASVQTSDLTLTGNVGGSVTNVQVVNGNTARFTVHFANGGSVTASIGAGTITANGCNGNAAFSGSYTVEGPAPCAWAAGPNLPTPPTVLIRAVGVFFPDGNFYTMGGRTSDLAGSDFQHVLRYSPGSNSWTLMGVTLPDNTMNNMACGVLTVSGTPQIYCVGGSAATQTTATARVFSYNPATDTATTLTGDDWPGAMGTILPGGFAVANNKLYILGGFNINVASTNQIWSFDPTAGVGSKWTLAPVTTPEGVMYAPTCTINGIIYLAGASDFQGGLVIDTTNSFSFNPATNTIGSIAPIPRATGETRGLKFCNKMYVMGGGRVAPNPSNQVDVYDPSTNSWSTGLPFVNARRNFPTDTDGTDNIWLAGGYEPAAPAGDMEIFHCPVSPCAASPTPTATATATATPTPTATPTATPAPRPTPTPRPRPTPPPRP